jgi:hypothetical protein
MTDLILWHFFLATLVGLGSAYFASRDPLTTSWSKIAFATAPLAGLGALALVLPITAEGWVSASIIIFLQIMQLGGIGVCGGVIVGTLFGMYRRETRRKGIIE